MLSIAVYCVEFHGGPWLIRPSRWSRCLDNHHIDRLLSTTDTLLDWDLGISHLVTSTLTNTHAGLEIHFTPIAIGLGLSGGWYWLVLEQMMIITDIQIAIQRSYVGY